MNTDPQNNGPAAMPTLDEIPQTPAFPLGSSPPGPNLVRSPRGKIARLPKVTRDKLNFMLRDGLEHKDVLAQLGDQATGLTLKNVSNWHTSPSYQHWLLQQDWIESLRADQESAFDLLNDFDVAKFNEGALQLAITRVFMAMRLEGGNLNDKLGGNARTFAGLVHALSRACHETTHIEKYRDACSKTAAAELQKLDPDRHLADSEYQLLANKMDKVFKIRRRPPGGAAGPPPGYAFFSQLQASKLKAQGSPLSTDAVPAPAPVGPLPPAGEPSESSIQELVPIIPHPVPDCPNPAIQQSTNPFIPSPPTPPLHDSTTPVPLESCLECGTLLPALLADGGRPQELCENCGEMLRRPGIYWKPSLDRCPGCGAALPHPLPTGERYSQYCIKCETFLPPYEPPGEAAPNLNLSPPATEN